MVYDTPAPHLDCNSTGAKFVGMVCTRACASAGKKNAHEWAEKGGNSAVLENRRIYIMYSQNPQ